MISSKLVVFRFNSTPVCFSSFDQCEPDPELVPDPDLDPEPGLDSFISHNNPSVLFASAENWSKANKAQELFPARQQVTSLGFFC